MAYQARSQDPFEKSAKSGAGLATLDDPAVAQRRQRADELKGEEDDDEPLLPTPISKSEVIYVTSQLAIMVDTGITLSVALGGILEQETNFAFRRVLADLKTSVEQGEDFSAALARYPKLFDKTYTSLVRASEATGSLGAMLERIASYLRKELETRSKVRAAMAYPGVMMILAVAVTFFLLTYILPKFLPIFKAKAMQLPKPTVVLMAVSDVLLAHWGLWLTGAVSLLIAALWFRRTARGRLTIDWLKIHLPILGPMYRKVIISRSIRTLGTMLANGVPMLEALRLCGEVAGNVYYERLWEEVRDRVVTGQRICEVLDKSPLFPRVLVQMIACGEETARLDFVLERVSTYYDQEVETSLKATTGMIEPLMIAVMGVVVGGIGMALLLPIFTLSKQP